MVWYVFFGIRFDVCYVGIIVLVEMFSWWMFYLEKYVVIDYWILVVVLMIEIMFIEIELFGKYLCVWVLVSIYWFFKGIVKNGVGLDKFFKGMEDCLGYFIKYF